MISGLSRAKSARANHTSAISLFAVCVSTPAFDCPCPASSGCRCRATTTRTPAIRLVLVERGGGLERVLGELHVDLARLDAAVEQHVEQEVVRRRVLREHDGLAAQIADVLDRRRATTMPSPPFDQSICWNTRGIVRGSRFRPLDHERQHVDGGPADVDVAGRERVAHRRPGCRRARARPGSRCPWRPSRPSWAWRPGSPR